VPPPLFEQDPLAVAAARLRGPDEAPAPPTPLGSPVKPPS
jgi:hypothetical protein